MGMTDNAIDKGFYIHAGSKTRFSGVNNKISDQIKALSSRFNVQDVIIEKECKNKVDSLFWRLPGGSYGRNYKNALESILQVPTHKKRCFFYIRYCPLDRRFLSFIARLKVLFPEASIILEIPTYPYYKEYMQSRTMWPWVIKDLVYRGELKKYIDRVATYSPDNMIFGIPTIKMINGIDITRIAPIGTEKKDGDMKIRLIAVAQFQASHGYERVIKGLKNYYDNGGTRAIELHLVGEGTEEKKYRDLSHKLGIEERVFFYGFKTGAELDDIYGNIDIGLSDFGLYKRGVTKSSALKVREYLARGIPVVGGSNNDAFVGSGKQYCLEYPNDSSIIDFEKMLVWYDSLIGRYGGRIRLASDIREYAKKTVDISVTMEPVINYLMKEVS